MKWLTLLALMAVAFAGCTDAQSDDPAPAAVTSPDETDETAQEPASTTAPDEVAAPVEETANETNTPPVVALSADHLRGSAGITLTFTVNATDADGDNVTWALSLGDDVLGEGAGNGTMAHTFNDEGVYLLVLNATDGSDAVNDTLEVIIDAPAPTGPCGGEPEPCIINENDHVEFWSDGICQAKDEFGDDMLGWIRQEPAMGIPGGNSLWIYQESNSMTGLQVHADEGGEYADCVNGDTVIF